MKKRISILIAVLMTVLMLLALLPATAIADGIKAKTTLTSIRFNSTEALKRPKLGDAIVVPSFYIFSTEPTGHTDIFDIYARWYNMDAQQTVTSGTFTKGKWSLDVSITIKSDQRDNYSVDTTAFKSGGSLNEVMINGITFKCRGYAETGVYYEAEFDVDVITITKVNLTSSTITAPKAGDSITLPEISVSSTVPTGADSAFIIQTQWRNDDEGKTYYSGTFKTGNWSLIVDVHLQNSTAYTLDYTDFYSGSLKRIKLGGQRFECVGMASTGVQYRAQFKVANGGCAPKFNTPTHSDLTGVVGAAFSTNVYQYVTGTEPITYSLASGTLPEGLELRTSDGLISGIPKAPGGYSFTIRASNSYGSDTIQVSLRFTQYTASFNTSDVQFKGSTPYVIYTGSEIKPRVIVKDNLGNTLSADKYTVTYLENKNAGTGYAEVKLPRAVKQRLFFKIYLPPTDSTTVANISEGIRITWDEVEGAAGYVIYRRAWNLVDAGWTTFERWNNTTDTVWTDTTVYAGTRYQYGVKAYFAKRTDPVTGATIGGAMDNYNLGEVGPLKTTVRITTRKITSVTGGKNQITVKWEGSSVFTGYQVQISTSGTFVHVDKAVTISNPKTVQTTFTGLQAGTTYYVRMRSYHVFDGTKYYGQWTRSAGKTQ